MGPNWSPHCYVQNPTVGNPYESGDSEVAREQEITKNDCLKITGTIPIYLSPIMGMGRQSIHCPCLHLEF